jgi:lipopolysaccharide export system permease protein
MFPPFLAGILAALMILVGDLIYWNLGDFLRKGVGFGVVLRFLVLKLPQILTMAIPIASLLACALVANRIGRESEAVAVRAAGGSAWRISRPMVFFGLLAGLFGFVIGDFVATSSNPKILELTTELGIRQAAATPENRNFFTSGDYTFYIGAVQRFGKEYRLKDVFVWRREYSERFPTFIAAQEGETDGFRWVLKEALVYVYDADGMVAVSHSTELKLDLTEDILSRLPDARGPEAMKALELWHYCKRLRASGENAQYVRSLEIDFWHRFAIPLASLVFCLLAAPLNLQMWRGGSMGGLLLAVGIIFFYWNMLALSKTVLGPQGILPVFVAAWLPTILFGGLGVWLNIRQR